MKLTSLAAGAVLALAATAASAQVYYGRTYEPRYTDSNTECWNPHAAGFERVRPGEYQDDLDFGRCRPAGYYVERRVYNDPQRQECWNPRARQYESVRPGERQDDLDYGRCRIYR